MSNAPVVAVYSMGGSADLIRFIMRNNYCFPSAIISYGICFGNDYHKQRLGDTIIVNKLYEKDRLYQEIRNLRAEVQEVEIVKCCVEQAQPEAPKEQYGKEGRQ